MQADLGDCVENEWLCGRLLEALGLSVARSTIQDFEDVHVLVVERFDRMRADRMRAGAPSTLVRLPQEDLCQALGVPPEKKYQTDGGPGIRAVMALLEGSARAQQDREDFIRTQIVFWLLAAIDGHAKNYSIFLQPGGRFRATPLHDVVSARPVMGRGPNLHDPHDVELAMGLWGTTRRLRHHLRSVLRRHFNATAKDCRLPGGAEPIIRDLLERVPGAVKKVSGELPPDFPDRVAAPILDGLAKAAEELDSMPPA